MSGKKYIEVSDKDLALVDANSLNQNQLALLFKETPEKHIYKRPAKGGGEWSYVTGIYIKKVLNLMFGWDWDFEVEKFEYDNKQVRVLGKLSCRVWDSNTNQYRSITKMQFGRVDIKYPKDEDNRIAENALDLGNDLKAATTDALKKCASEIGIASDIYGANEFKAIKILDIEEEDDPIATLQNEINELIRDEPEEYQQKQQSKLLNEQKERGLSVDFLTELRDTIKFELQSE